MTLEPRRLLTVSEVAQLLHVSDDTVRRQIKEGDLEAIQIGTTPKGRPRYRIPSAVVEHKLSRRTTMETPALDRLREAFSVLSDEEQADLIERAIRWARDQTPDPPRDTSRLPELTREEIERQLTQRAKTWMAKPQEE